MQLLVPKAIPVGYTVYWRRRHDIEYNRVFLFVCYSVSFSLPACITYFPFPSVARFSYLPWCYRSTASQDWCLLGSNCRTAFATVLGQLRTMSIMSSLPHFFNKRGYAMPLSDMFVSRMIKLRASFLSSPQDDGPVHVSSSQDDILPTRTPVAQLHLRPASGALLSSGIRGIDLFLKWPQTRGIQYIGSFYVLIINFDGVISLGSAFQIHSLLDIQPRSVLSQLGRLTLERNVKVLMDIIRTEKRQECANCTWTTMSVSLSLSFFCHQSSS